MRMLREAYHLFNFFAHHNHIRREKCRNPFPLPDEGAGPEALEPLALRYDGIGLQPVFQVKKVGCGDSSVFESLDQMIENSARGRPPDPRHSLSGSVLLMENETFQLIRQLPDLGAILRRFDALQQRQDGPI